MSSDGVTSQNPPDYRAALPTYLKPVMVNGRRSAQIDWQLSVSLLKAKRFARTPPNVSGRQPRYRHGALRRRPGLQHLLLVKTGVSMYEEPYRHYWRLL